MSIRKRLPLRAVAIPAAVAAFAFALTSCAAAPEPIEVAPGAVLLDVRTPSEYAEGHLDGAQLLDFNGGELAAAIPSLDPEAEYLVYCRSGNRSGQAIALMQQAGFSHLTNLGSLEQAASAVGIEIVR
ncbi:MAG: rhodanese-like domain-containing protein [Leucobacter sp.]|nr:rhodanese-like domain-containing protein [Leucobacter sp.]